MTDNGHEPKFLELVALILRKRDLSPSLVCCVTPFYSQTKAQERFKEGQKPLKSAPLLSGLGEA